MRWALAGVAVTAVSAWSLLSLWRPWSGAYVPASWPHKVMGVVGLAGVAGLLLLARRRPALALGLLGTAVALAAADLVCRWGVEGGWAAVPGRFLVGTAGPLLAAALLMASCVGWGTVAGRLARVGPLSIPDRLALGILFQALVLLGAGSLGLLHVLLGWTLLLAGTAGWLPELRADLARARGIRLPAPLACLWLAPAVLTILFGTLRALAPEIDGDSLRYHLALPRLYLQSGSTAFRPENCFSLMPGYGQMMHLLSMMVSGDTPSRLLGVAALGASLRAAWEWARRYDAERLPWITVGLLGAVIQWRESVGTAMMENFIVLFATLSLLHLSRALESQGGPRGSLVLAGLFAGGVAGSKLFGASFPVFLAAGILLADRRRWKGALVLGSLGILVASPWYVRSALYTGNPFWPSLEGLFGNDAALQQQNLALLEELRGRYGLSTSWLQFPLLPVYAAMHGARYDVALDPWVAAWLPAILATRRAAVVNAGLWMTLGTAALLYTYVPLVRFFAGCFPVLALAAAWAMRDSMRGRLGPAVSAMFLAFACATSATHLPAVERALLPVLGLESRDRYAAPWVAAYRVSRHASRVLPPDAAVLVVDYADTYYLERTVRWTPPSLQHDLLLSAYPDAAGVANRLRGLGVGYVVARGADPLPGVPGERRGFTVMFAADGWSLFRLEEGPFP